MKLYPKARPVRIKLIVGEEEHSSLDSLRDNFDVVEILRLFENGGLKNWLKQINKEDIFRQLNGQNCKEISQKYENVYDAFFPEKRLSLEDRLIDLQGKRNKSFNNLLNLLLNSKECSLTVACALKIAKTNGKDDETCRTVSSYLYNNVENVMQKIYSLYKNDYNVNKYEILALIRQLKCQWNVRKQSDKGSEIEKMKNDINLIINEINKADVFRKLDMVVRNPFNFPLSEIYKLSVQEREKLESAIENLQDSLECIKQSNYSISAGDYVNILNDSFFLTSNGWYSLYKQISNFGTMDTMGQITNWKKAIVKMLLISFILKEKIPNNNVTTKLRRLFVDNGGLKKLVDSHEIVWTEFSKINESDPKGITKFLAQSMLFISYLALYKHKNSLNKLIDGGFRPAIILSDKPKSLTQSEKVFLQLDDMVKIEYLIKNKFIL